MFYNKNIIYFILCVLLSLQLIANEHGEEAAAGADSENYSGKQSQDWELIQKKLGELKAKRENQETILKNLIKKSNDTVTTAGHVEEIKTEHKKLEEMTAEYNKLSDEFETRFPEKGLKDKRKYQRVASKSIEGYKQELSKREKLNLLHQKMLNQYGVKKNVVNAKPNDKNVPKTKEQVGQKKSAVSDDVTEAIIFKK